MAMALKMEGRPITNGQEGFVSYWTGKAGETPETMFF